MQHEFFFFIFVLALARYKLQYYYHRSPPLHRVEEQRALHDNITIHRVMLKWVIGWGVGVGDHLMWCNWLMEIIKYK